jgi:L-lactate utilization protein LutB
MTKITPSSAVNLIPHVGVDAKKWNTLPAPDVVRRTIAEIERRGITVISAANGDEALAVLRRIIPPGAEVMNGSSITLAEIGYDDLIAGGGSGWKKLHDVITAENDDAKRAELRRKSVTAEYFISGVNAIAESGEIVACDASGSRVGAWAFAAGHLILVAGINKVVPTLDDAFKRIRDYAYRLEDARARKVYGTPSVIGKCVILAHEKIRGRVTLVLVSEALGY